MELMVWAKQPASEGSAAEYAHLPAAAEDGDAESERPAASAMEVLLGGATGRFPTSPGDIPNSSEASPFQTARTAFALHERLPQTLNAR